MQRLILASAAASVLASCQAPKQPAKHSPRIDRDAAHAGAPVKPAEPAATGSGAAAMQDEMARAARALWRSLTPEQQAQTTIGFDDPERQNWTYVPRRRRGLSWKQMTPAQRELARALLRTGLSRRGDEKADAIMKLEQILGELEGRGSWRDPELYYVTIFGEPGPVEPWGWRVEGHHLSLNFTMVAGEGAASPAFMGANPARVPHGPGKGSRVLAAEEDLARHLIQSLDPEQRAIAVIAAQAPSDLVSGDSRRLDPMRPAGLGAARLTGAQKQLLMELIREYANRLRKELAEADLREIAQAGLDEVHFAWAGGIAPGERHYYRIQGPTFLVEYDNTQNGGNHIHSVWRDPANDFGEDLLERHYQEHRHGGDG